MSVWDWQILGNLCQVLKFDAVLSRVKYNTWFLSGNLCFAFHVSYYDSLHSLVYPDILSYGPVGLLSFLE